jgi:hypothetical protein
MRSSLLAVLIGLVQTSCVSESPPPSAGGACAMAMSTAPSIALTIVGGNGVLLITSSTSNTVSSSSYVDASTVTVRTSDGSIDGATSSVSMTTSAGSLAGDASVSVTTLPDPVPVAVALELTASFPCPVEGDVHATMTTSVGQFASGLAPSGGAIAGAAGSDGGASAGAASGGSSGVAGASVTVLLGATAVDAGADAADDGGSDGATDLTPAAAPSSIAANGADPSLSSVLVGYATVQLTSDRITFIQAVVGDATLCGQLVVDGTLDPSPNPNALVTARLVPCDVSTMPDFDQAPDASVDATLLGPEGGISDAADEMSTDADELDAAESVDAASD